MNMGMDGMDKGDHSSVAGLNAKGRVFNAPACLRAYVLVCFVYAYTGNYTARLHIAKKKAKCSCYLSHHLLRESSPFCLIHWLMDAAGDLVLLADTFVYCIYLYE